jgi:flagellar hook-associated protein FlgK
MPINQLEMNLQAITQTIAFLEKSSNDENLVKELKKERDKLLRELNVIF